MEDHICDFQPTKYDQWELRCAVNGCCTAKILPGNPRYCQASLINARHTPHEFQYWYVRYGETEKTLGSTWCRG